MHRHTSLAVTVVALLAAATPARADETTFCNKFITSLPYTITVQGHYCFNRNLSTAITSGNAITIDVDFVVLDLNNFKLGGGAAGIGSDATGVRVLGSRSNATIRNGNVRGFRWGIAVEGGANHVIENNVLDGNTQAGILADGDNTVVRDNIVTAVGFRAGVPYTVGINGDGGFVLAEHNLVAGVNSSGYYVFAYGIALPMPGSAAIGNVVRDLTSGFGYLGVLPGIALEAEACIENLVQDTFATTSCTRSRDNIFP
jgi:parallel beta-helix repeat protein